MNKYLQEVLDRVRTSATSTPASRAAFRAKYTFSELGPEEQLAIWDHIWHKSDDPNIRLHAFMYCETLCARPELLVGSWTTIMQWQEQIQEWWLCDAMSKIYTKILEQEPVKVYKVLKEWNKSENLWKRRQSVVSLLYFQSTKKVYLPFDKIIPLIHTLLHDEEYYVQKAVGWALKELYCVYPKETYEYLVQNIKSISAIAFSPAIEKIPAPDKLLLKQKRR